MTGRHPVQMKDIPEIARLSTPEKILLVEDSWDSIARGESDVAIPQSHRDTHSGESDHRFRSK